MDMGTLLNVPIVAPSALAIPTLETIPGSASPTPPLQSLRTTPVELADNSGMISDLPVCEAGPSRPPHSRQPSYTNPSTTGSYFSGIYSTPSRAKQHYSPSPSPAGTPYSERPRPSPLEMPLGTPDDPLFSNYPSTAPSRASPAKGKARALPFPLASAFQFQLAEPIRRRRHHRHHGDKQMEGQDSSGSTSSAEQGKRRGRRRANTVSYSPPFGPSSPTSPETVQRPGPEERTSFFRRRRASLGSQPFGKELDSEGDDASQWPSMPGEEARRMAPQPEIPYAYPQPGEVDYTLAASPRPLSSPHITPRRSSLAPTLASSPRNNGSPTVPTTPTSLGCFGGRPGVAHPTALLGLSDLGETDHPDHIPHEPPPRRSSLSFGPSTVIQVEPISIPDLPSPGTHAGSIMSASLSTTEESSSAAFSPSYSGAHPLSSATTSLSRSAKSGKEGSEEAAKDAALTALKLQRSLEWEAKQTTHRRKLEKRRMILLELVETEVAYAEDLKALVEVYLPQLHALPSVLERTASAVARNAAELLVIHSELSLRMVEVLKEEELGYEMLPEEDLVSKVERVSRRVAGVLVDKASSFSAYNEFCAGSIAASTLVRNISLRTDYTAFERRCQIISSSQPPVRLQDLLDETLPPSFPTNKNRLHFRDYLIMPIQRVCRYPLLLAALLGAADTPSPSSHEVSFGDNQAQGVYEYDVGVDVERALGAMRGVAEEADDARRQKESQIKTATIISRLEAHPVLTPEFIKSLGSCRLIGSLDVLHHHPTIAPLVPPVKVKYLAAFLYKGYLVLAKVKKGKVYEAKHFLPLEVFELIDIAEGFLPHSVRLSLREHSFDLAASCEAEKEVWSSALTSARDESTVPPFELPASVSPFAARSRRVSHIGPAPDSYPKSPIIATPNKRHTLGALPLVTPDFDQKGISPEMINLSSPTARTPSTLSGTGPILLRRATPNQRLTVDRGLLDIFSESCAQARSKAQLHHALFLPDLTHQTVEMREKLSMRESTMLRRRRSFLDSASRQRTSSMDIAFSGEVKGSVIPIRPVRSSTGSKRESRITHTRQSSTNSLRGNGTESATEMDIGDDTATSDFGTLRGYSYNNDRGIRTRGTSIASASPSLSPIKTLGSFRPGLEAIASAAQVPRANPDTSHESGTFISGPGPTRFASFRKSIRKSASVVNLYQRPSTPHRAQSTPASPVVRAQRSEMEGGGVKRSSSDPDRPSPSKENSPIADSDVPPLPPPKERPVMMPIRTDSDPSSNGEVEEMRSETDDQFTPAQKEDHAGPRPSIDTANLIYALGNGLTNTPERNSAGPWGTLRRTLTSRSARNSVISLNELSQTVSSGQGSPAGSIVGSPSTPVGSTKERRMSPSRSISTGWMDGHTRSSSEPVRTEVDEGGIVLAPRRKRSVRLLQGLRGFTAM